jgi:signal transduction histidine kinase
MALPAIMRTTAARLSALYFLLFAVIAVILVFYMTSLSVRMLTAQTQDTINEEVLGLDAAYRRGGLPLLVRTITLRARQPGANLYLIADGSGTILSGNVESLDPEILQAEGWTDTPFTYQRYGEAADAQQAGGETETRHDAIALVLRLPNRMIVLVGRDLGEPVRLQKVVRSALALALGLMALSGLLIWFAVGRRALRRIDRVSDASRRIMGGDLSGRLPVSGSGDEFDRLSESLNRMLAKISDLNEGLKQVSDNIAHDLKTPLTRLRNQAEAALARGDDPAGYREALEGAIQRSDGLIRTFNAILMISRLEAGQGSGAPLAPTDLAQSVRDVLELYEALAEERGVALEVTVDGSFTINGNRELVGQALANVVDNAIKYAAPVPDARVAVALVRNGGEIRLSVTDNGPGIPDAADRARATERFVRLEKSRTEPGSGLGLSIARAVMKFHGGRLELADAAPGLAVVMAFPAVEKTER